MGWPPKPTHDRDYGSASYLAISHPDDTDSPDGQFWVEVAFCRRCGAIVHDIARHNEFHVEGFR